MIGDRERTVLQETGRVELWGSVTVAEVAGMCMDLGMELRRVRLCGKRFNEISVEYAAEDEE